MGAVRLPQRWLRLFVGVSKIATGMFEGWSCERKISLMVNLFDGGS